MYKIKSGQIGRALIALTVSLSFGLTSLTIMAKPSRCPSVAALKAKASSNGLKKYGNRYLFRQYSNYNTGNRWEFVITNVSSKNAKVTLKKFRNGYSGLRGAPRPSEKMGKGTWICEYRMAGHKVVATFPALCSEDLCG